jgi:pyridoxine 5'-phosphate synthase PdxJ
MYSFGISRSVTQPSNTRRLSTIYSTWTLVNKQKLKRSVNFTEQMGNMMQERSSSMDETLKNMKAKYNEIGLFEDNKALEASIKKQASQIDTLSGRNANITDSLQTIFNKVSHIELTEIEGRFAELKKEVS